MKLNELERKIKNGDKEEIDKDFNILITNLSKDLDIVEELKMNLFIYQLRDYIIKQCN